MLQYVAPPWRHEGIVGAQIFAQSFVNSTCEKLCNVLNPFPAPTNIHGGSPTRLIVSYLIFVFLYFCICMFCILYFEML